MEEMGPSAKLREEVGEWRDGSPGKDRFMYLVNRIGKGRLAQRLAQAELEPPDYVREALDYLAD